MYGRIEMRPWRSVRALHATPLPQGAYINQTACTDAYRVRPSFVCALVARMDRPPLGPRMNRAPLAPDVYRVRVFLRRLSTRLA